MTPCTHSLWYSIPHTVYLQSGNRTPALLPSQAQFAENYTSITCARQVYVMPDPGLNGAAIGGDAIAEVCIRKASVSGKASSNSKTLTIRQKQP